MSKYVMAPLLALSALALIPCSMQWAQANTATVGFVGTSTRILFEETSLMVPSVRSMLVKNSGMKSLAMEVMGAKAFSGTDAQISLLFSKLNSSGSTKAAASLIQELNGRLASMPTDKAAQAKWLDQQIKIPVGQFATMDQAKAVQPVSVTNSLSSSQYLNTVAYAQLVNEKGKAAGVSAEVIEGAIQAREKALRLNWISAGHDQCLKEKFSEPFAVQAILAFDGAAADPNVKTVVDVRKEAFKRLRALYPNESAKQVKKRMCEAFSAMVNPDCDVFNLGKACTK